MQKHMWIGNLTRDPELRNVNTKDGNRTVCSFTIAVNGRNGVASYVRVSAWDKLGENCDRYLAKGRKVFVESNSLTANTYQTQSGSTGVSLEATAQNVVFLSPAKNDGDAAEPPANADMSAPEQNFTQVQSDDLPF